MSKRLVRSAAADVDTRSIDDSAVGADLERVPRSIAVPRSGTGVADA